MNMLEQAIEIAVEAHNGQVDRAGRPYILHPLHLMMQMETEEETYLLNIRGNPPGGFNYGHKPPGGSPGY